MELRIGISAVKLTSYLKYLKFTVRFGLLRDLFAWVVEEKGSQGAGPGGGKRSNQQNSGAECLGGGRKGL